MNLRNRLDRLEAKSPTSRHFDGDVAREQFLAFCDRLAPEERDAMAAYLRDTTGAVAAPAWWWR